MKFTDEERKEVAKKLRDKHKERNKPLFFEPQDMGIQAFNYLKDLQSCLPDADSTFIVIADLIEPEPEQTFDEWLKDVKETCFANMEGCGEPEWSLFSTINDSIGLYLSGKSGYGCKMIDYDDSCYIDQINETQMQCSKCNEIYEWIEVEMLEDSKLEYEGNYCRCCGRKVINK